MSNGKTDNIKHAAAEIFVNKDRVARIWMGVCALLLAWHAVDRWQLYQTFNEASKGRVIIMDAAGNYFTSPLLSYTEAKDLHAAQARLAAMARFNRTPAGLSDKRLAETIFMNEGYETLLASVKKENPDFEAKQLFQSVNFLGETSIVSREDGSTVTSTPVQLIRNGTLEGAPIAETVTGKMLCLWFRNKDMSKNGRFPTACVKWEFRKGDEEK